MNPIIARFTDASWTRRRLMQGVGFGALALGLPEMLRLRAAAPKRVKSCILLWLFGGPSHIDIWDMKPDAPVEYRGEFKSIATSAPGIRLCEHLPRTAKLAHHLALVRSVTMSGRVIGDGDHHADTYYMLTGHRPDRSFFAESINRKPKNDDWPFIGSVVAWQRAAARDGLPGVVQLPARSGEITGYVNPGQFSGLLGPAYEPFMVRGTLDKPRELTVPQFALPADIDLRRLGDRKELLKRIDGWHHQETGHTYDVHHQKAMDVLTSRQAKRAFDLSLEPPAVRDRYGEDVNGQSVLLARRLVEAGVPSVCVHWIGKTIDGAFIWDTHGSNFKVLKTVLLPAFDACYSALLEDLEQRGLLDETLVVVMAEMGRKPRIGDPRSGGDKGTGRDHWIHCQTVLFAGGGIKGGQVYGASDKVGAYPADRPVYPEHLAATMYQALGIPEERTFRSREGRPMALLEDARSLPLF